MYVGLTRMPGENYRRQLVSLCTLAWLACQVRVTVGNCWSLCTLAWLACQVRVTVGDWLSLCTLAWLACQVCVTVGDSGLCCVCVTSFEPRSVSDSAMWLLNCCLFMSLTVVLTSEVYLIHIKQVGLTIFYLPSSWLIFDCCLFVVVVMVWSCRKIWRRWCFIIFHVRLNE